MKLTNTKLAEIFWEMLASGKNKQIVANQIAAYLIENRRTKDLKTISRIMRQINYSKTGQIEITATSKYPLTQDIKDLVTKLFNAKTAKFTQISSAGTIGGARFKTDGMRVDLTHRNKLNNLRYAFLGE